MRPREYLGQYELMVLLAILQVGDEAYGVPIAREIEEATKKDVSLGSIYGALGRLERKGLIASETGAPTPERGGRAKTYFRVTPKGIREVRQARARLLQLSRGLPQLEGGRA